MSRDARASELRQLATFLVLDLAFFAIVIPAGIADPEGFGLDQGLPPSFLARLVSILAATLLLARAAQLLVFGDDASDASGATTTPEDVLADDQQTGFPVRGVLGMTAALVFAIGLAPIIGFYLGGFLLTFVVLRVLGEVRLSSLFVYPVVIMLLVWGLFDQLLSIRLPVGVLLAG